MSYSVIDGLVIIIIVLLLSNSWYSTGECCVAVSVTQFAGLSLIALGVVVTTKSSTYSGFIRIPVNPVGIALNAVGAFIFASGFFGCCSVRRTHFCAVVTVSPVAVSAAELPR